MNKSKHAHYLNRDSRHGLRILAVLLCTFLVVAGRVSAQSVRVASNAADCTTARSLTTVCPINSSCSESAPSLDHHQALVPLYSMVAATVERSEITVSPLDSSSQLKSTTAQSTKQSTQREPKSPGGAIVRSLVCPGWGQLYNESYWKSALFFGGAATATGILLWNNAKFLDANTTFSTPGISAAEKDLAYYRREFYRDQRDVAGLWLLGIYVLASVDAYVGAHLFDFDVSDKGIGLLPTAQPGSYALMAQIRF